MSFKESLMAFYSIMINDEQLLRLLYYKADHLEDDVLLISDRRPNIIGSSSWPSIVENHIKRTPKTNDLVEEKICRILIEPFKRKSPSIKYISEQGVLVSVLTHLDYDDFRLEAICDRVDDLFANKKITGLQQTIPTAAGKMPKSEVPINYLGFNLEYSFGAIVGEYK